MLFSGQKTFTTTAAQLNANDVPVSRVTLKAAAGNGGNLFVGGSSGVSTTTGLMLDAGQEITVEIQNLDEIWLIGSASGQVVEFIATDRPNR